MREGGEAGDRVGNVPVQIGEQDREGARDLAAGDRVPSGVELQSERTVEFEVLSAGVEREYGADARRPRPGPRRCGLIDIEDEVLCVGARREKQEREGP